VIFWQSLQFSILQGIQIFAELLKYDPNEQTKLHSSPTGKYPEAQLMHLFSFLQLLQFGMLHDN
jgi:hypothetical protein